MIMRGNSEGRNAMVALVVALQFTAGCSRAPSFDILGSLFPAWLVCLIFAVALTAFCHFLFLRLQLIVAYPILVYPGLIAIFTFSLWLLSFQ
jgi:hypothetical protein